MSTKNVKTTSEAMDWMEYFKHKEDGKKELGDYIENNEIPLIKIDKKFLTKPMKDVK